MPMVYLGLQWDHTPEVLWLIAQDARQYLDDWYLTMLMDFLNSSYALDEEGHEDLIYHAVNQSGV